ncbi:hypothetical protein OSB04_010916 [Centaurea solstitialis]|uniref:Uncharacterized protein n=1 Tax=Centaurea solstitialis TaxID=347529 RepID=A0AA38TRJ2_9ASTR|nr:hypothetical protein OSB04_010916 [Centaurea solstitialis]
MYQLLMLQLRLISQKDKTISLEHARSGVDHSIPKIKILERKKGANHLDGHIEVNETPEKSLEETLDMMVPEEPQFQIIPECSRLFHQMEDFFPKSESSAIKEKMIK